MNNKNIVIRFFFILTFFSFYCFGQNKDITLNFKIKKKDVGKIEFRAPENKKHRAKWDMTSVVDSIWYVGDTLYVTYMQRTYRVSIKYHDGDTIYMCWWTTQFAPLEDSFTQSLSVPQRPKYLCLNNNGYIFCFQKVSLRKYQLLEYHLVDSTAQNKIQWHLGSQDSIKRDDTVRPSSKLRPDPTDGINRK